jgi:alkylation response protein AidB-like acyl-CoA dehydrogenase
MELELTAEERDLEVSADRLLKREWQPDDARRAGESDSPGPAEEKLWTRIADAGWFGIAFREEVGGGGGTLFDLGLIYRQFGKHLIPPSVSNSISAALFVDALGDRERHADLLRPLLEGSAVGTVALTEPTIDTALELTRTRATPAADGGYTITGTKSLVMNARDADVILVGAMLHPGAQAPAIFAIEPDKAQRVTFTPRSAISRDRLADVTFEATHVPGDALLGNVGDSSTTEYAQDVRHVLDRLVVLQCMEMLGGAEQVLRATAAYVSTREQFGRPVGSFQAVQMHAAEMYTAAYAARVTCLKALSEVSRGKFDRRMVSIAKALTAQAFREITVRAHQLQGGIGIATESDLYLSSRRAKFLEAWLGGCDYHLSRIADAVLT